MDSSRVEPTGTARQAKSCPRATLVRAINEEWSGRWESNPRGRSLRAFKAGGLARMLTASVFSV
jgi:hypothetical protein